MAHRRDDQLRDAHAIFDGEGGAAEVDQGNPQFASVVAIDGAGGVGDADAVLGGEAGAGADLTFVPLFDGDGPAGRDNRNVTGEEGDGGGKGGGDVHPCRAGGLVGRDG